MEAQKQIQVTGGNESSPFLCIIFVQFKRIRGVSCIHIISVISSYQNNYKTF